MPRSPSVIQATVNQYDERKCKANDGENEDEDVEPETGFYFGIQDGRGDTEDHEGEGEYDEGVGVEGALTFVTGRCARSALD